MIPVQKRIETILKACDNKKAYDFVVLDVSKSSSITDYFIICSGNNEKQTAAIAEEVLPWTEASCYFWQSRESGAKPCLSKKKAIYTL
jgi:ribosomal silencing factor RsfS